MREMKNSGIEWIGEIPKDKKVLRNKYMFSYEKGKLPFSTNLDKKGFAYIGASDLDSNKNEYTTYTEDVTIPNSEYNDLLVLWDGARAGLCGTHKIGKISSTIVRIKGDETVYQPFLYWYYKGFENFMYQSVNGTTIPHMNRKYIENIGFIDWTIQEQQKISAYLDTKCTKIDSIIEKQEKIIEKLKAYKLSLITETVTKGLNPDVKMKGSGIEWIGEIPEHWKVSRIKYVTDFQPFCDTSHLSTDSIITYTPMENIKNGWYIPNTCEYGKLAKSLTQYCDGDIVMAKVTPCFENGNIAIMNNLSNGFGLGSSELFVFRPRNIDTKYLFYWLRNDLFIKSACSTMTGTGGLKRISSYFTKNCYIHIPLDNEQKQIADYLDKKCSAIDKSIEQKQAIIEKLKEYKKSLIYEVVTGKREV